MVEIRSWELLYHEDVLSKFISRACLTEPMCKLQIPYMNQPRLFLVDRNFIAPCIIGFLCVSVCVN